MKILISEKLSPAGIAYLKEQGFETDVKLGLSVEELEAIIGDYDALIVRSATQVNESLLAKAKNLKVVGRAGNGVDNINVPECTKQGVVVVNTPEANIMAAAEMAVALTMTIFRNIHTADRMAQKDDFRRSLLAGNEVEGKTAGIIGIGRIGAIVARKLQGLGMKVIAFDEYAAPERFERMKIGRCANLDELLEKSDLITIHTPKTKESYNMITAKELAKTKKGVRIVNAARGGLVNEKDLYEALESGQVAAAAIDVMDKEPNYTAEPGAQHYENPLISHPHCLCMPHLGASSVEASENVSTAVTELVAKVLQGELVAAVNLPAMHGSMKDLAPWIQLAELLGTVYFQCEKAAVKKLEVRYSGNLVAEETGILTLSVMKGLLTPISDSRISFVNVKENVDALGIQVTEVKDAEQTRYENMITLVFETEEKQLVLGGTVFVGGKPMLVDFFGYQVDIAFGKHMLALHNDDVPGIIGAIGTKLGQENININAVHWAGKPDRKRAQAMLVTDTPVDSEMIKNLASIPGVLHVSKMEFEV